MTDDYWYNESKKYFYVPNKNKIIPISAVEFLIIIDDMKLFNWNSFKIFNKTIWKSDVTHQMIDLIIRDYNLGLFDSVIGWICDNNIECDDVDKKDYLSL